MTEEVNNGDEFNPREDIEFNFGGEVIESEVVETVAEPAAPVVDVQAPVAAEVDAKYQEMVVLYNQRESSAQPDRRKLTKLYKEVRDVELQRLITQYNLKTLCEGPNATKVLNLLNRLANGLTELKMALLCEEDKRAIDTGTSIGQLLTTFRQKFPDNNLSMGVNVLIDILGEDLFNKLMECGGEDPDQEGFVRFPGLGEESTTAPEEERRAGRMAKAVRALLGKAIHDLPKSRKAYRAVFGLCGAATAAALGAPVTVGLTAGTLLYAGIRGVGLLKNARRPSRPVDIISFVKNLGTVLNKKIDSVGEFAYDFVSIREHEKTLEGTKSKNFYINRTLEATGLLVGIPLGGLIAFATEVLPVSSLIKVSKTVLGISDIYAAGWLPRRFADIAGWLAKNEEKVKNIDKYSHENYTTGDELRKVANAMAFTATSTVVAIQALKIALRLSNAASSKSYPQNGNQKETNLQSEDSESTSQANQKSTPQPTVMPTPEAEQDIVQPQATEPEIKPEIKNGGGVFDKTDLGPQASIAGAEELELEEIMEPEITVKRGGTFWNSMNIKNEGWTNPANGVTQSDVIRDATADLFRAKGIEVDRIAADSHFDLAKILNAEEEELLRKIAKTTSVGDYWKNVRPEYLRLMKEAAAEAMKPKGAN